MNSVNPTRRLREATTKIRKLFDELESEVDWETFAKGDFAAKSVPAIKRTVPELSRHFGAVNSALMSRARDGGRITGLKQRDVDYIRDVIVPREELINDLFVWVLFISDDDSKDEQFLRRELKNRNISPPNVAGRDIKATFQIAIDRLTNDWPSVEEYEWAEQLDLRAGEEIVESPYFQPDTWHENVRQIRPVLLGKHPALDKALSIRLAEVYKSFILGNYLAPIAMARAVLEFALKEYCDEHGFRKERPTLEEYIDFSVASESRLDQHAMNFVRVRGNAIMHRNQRAEENVLELPPSRDTAKRCIEALVETIEVLFPA